MKLYTEEQVREVLSNMLLTTEQVESILKELKPQGELKQSPEHIKPGMIYVKFKEKEIEKISEDEARIREILNDPSSVFVGYSQEGYNLHIWINQGKKYYIEPELNIINKIEY